MMLAVTDPNFSIIVPGECNAHCEFCFWEPTPSLGKSEYLAFLVKAIGALPRPFAQCSITGGEPMLSEWLLEILQYARANFTKVVLSTNGSSFDRAVLQYVDHLNISRHHYLETENSEAFRTYTIPTTLQIEDICRESNARGVDVTLNCVLPADFTDYRFVFEYIAYAKTVGANAVCFRKTHSDLTPLPVEGLIGAKVVSESGCPACATRVNLLNGMKTTWRYGVSVPSYHVKGIYELIAHPNGKVTMDWEGKIETGEFKTETFFKEREARAKVEGCGGCGQAARRAERQGCGSSG